MGRLLVVVSLLAVGSAHAGTVYEHPMDGGAGGWGCSVSVLTELGRTFTRAHDFNDEAWPQGYWYCNTYTGEMDVS